MNVCVYVCLFGALQYEWMFGGYSEADVIDEIDGSASVMLPVTSLDHVMLEQAENIGNSSTLVVRESLCSKNL